LPHTVHFAAVIVLPDTKFPSSPSVSKIRPTDVWPSVT